MKKFYKAEYKGQIEVRSSDSDYVVATFLLGMDDSIACTWHKSSSAAGKPINRGYFQPIAVVPVTEIHKAEFDSIKAGA
jgi:hypothetical protein